MKRFSPVMLSLFFLVTASPLMHAQITTSTPIPSAVRPFIFPSARYNALGGAHAAVADDFYTLFSNPAGFASLEKSLSVAEFSVDVKDWDMIYTVLFGDASSFISNIFNNTIRAGIDSSGPIAVGYINRGWGIGIFNATRLNLVWNPLNVMEVFLHFSEELIAATGYAYRLGEISSATFDIGVLGKMFFRGLYQHTMQVQDVRYFLENLGDYDFQTHMGFGLDAGFKFTLVEAFALGFVFHDFLSPVLVNNYGNFDKFLNQRMVTAGMSQVQKRIDIGLSVRVISPGFHRVISDLIIMATYGGISESFAEEPRDILLDISAGVEVRILEALRLRGGWGEMQPSFGIGLDFTAFQLDIAYYGEEFSTKVNGSFRNSLAIAFIFRYQQDDYL